VGVSLTVLVRGLGVENLKRARQALESLTGALTSRATDSLRVSVVSSLPESPFNLAKVAGTALTGRDWSSDFARLQNIDVALSSRASESTLAGIKAQTDKLAFDASSRLRINAEVVANPPNLDVALSSRASEATLSSFSSKFPSATALADNLGNPTTTIVGSALLGWDGTYWRRVAVDTSSRLKVVVESVANPPNLDVALSTRASESTLSAIAGALATRATDKLRVSVVDVLPESPFNLAKVGGIALTGRDWSSDFARLQNLDVPLSSRASEDTLGTVASLVTGLSALDYDIISLDLSTARTDALVASNVVFLRILDSTTGTAQYTLKLFATTRKTITQDMAPPGTAFERLRRASVYVSNPAQPAGTKLDLFVLTG
jgi:hypothetical protein